MLKLVKKRRIEVREEIIKENGQKEFQTVEKVVEGDLNFKYNGVTRLVKAGETIDIRDFSQPKSPILTNNVAMIEKALLIKYPGTFEQVKSFADPKQEKLYQEELDVLKKENAALKKALDEQKKFAEEMQTKHYTSDGGVKQLEKQILSLKKEIDTYEPRIKELEDENQQLRLQVSGGKRRKK